MGIGVRRALIGCRREISDWASDGRSAPLEPNKTSGDDDLDRDKTLRIFHKTVTFPLLC